MLARRLLSTITKEDDEPKDPWMWWGARNVDEFDQHYPRVLNGVLTVLDAGGGADALLTRHEQALAQDLERIAKDLAKDDDKAKTLSAYPRVKSRLQFLRRVAIAAGRPDRADAADLLVLERFKDDEKLLPRLVRERLDWGLVASARTLLDKGPADEEQKKKLRFLVGAGSTEGAAFVPVPQAARLYLPLLAAGKTEEARVLLRRVDFTSLGKDDLEHMPVLLSGAVQMEDGGLALSIGRHWVRTLIKTDKQGRMYYSVAPMVSRIGALIEKDKFKSLCQYIVSLILQDLEKAGSWMNLIPMLQANFEEPLLDDEQVADLLEKVDGNRWYWVGSFFSLVRDRERPAALRKVLPKVPKTRRMQFLLSLLEQIQDEIGQDFADFIAESFDTAVADLDKKDQFVWYQFLNIANGDKNLDLRLRLAKVPLDRGIDNDLVRAAHAVLLQKMDRPEDALKDALAVYGNIIGKPQNDFHANMARQMITQAFLPKHTEAFIAHLETIAKEGAPAMDVTLRRLELAQRAGDADVLLKALRRAVTDHPDNDGFKNRLYHQLNRAGRRLEAMAILTAMAEAKPKDVALKRRLLTGWRSMHQPIKALAVKQQIDDLAKAKTTDAKDKPEETAKKTKRFVSPVDLKKAIDEDRLDDARRMLRRMWRSFPVGDGNRYYPVFAGTRRYTWPVTRKEPTEADKQKAKERARGGLASFSDEIAKPVERMGMYEALSAYPFAEAEMRRQLRTWGGVQLSMGGELIEGVAKAMVTRVGRKEAAKALLDQIEQGRAGKLEYALLLGMLDEDIEGAGVDAEALLTDLARTVKPSDVGQVMRLARIWARMGGQAEAARLFKWCAAQSPAQGGGVTYVMVGGTFMPRGGGVDAYTLVKEVGKELEGDLRIRTIEEILALADPGNDQRYGPTARDGYESLVLKTWIDVLGEDAALERCRPILDDVPNLERGLRRMTARTAAALLARAGEHEQALRCLEVALCSLTPPGTAQRWHRQMYTRPGSLGFDDIRRLFPVDGKDLKDATAWYAAAHDALTKWLDADRASMTYLFRPLVILALRLHQAGAAEPASALLARLEAEAAEKPSDLLWVIDLARALGQEDKAYALERGLLESNQLIVTRLVEVLDHVAEREGPEEALDLAEKTAEVTLYPALLDALVELAEATDELERAMHWQGVRKQAEAAREALEAKPEDAEKKGVPAVRIR
nr:hypothetical protein [Planctomycetota bacterium]